MTTLFDLMAVGSTQRASAHVRTWGIARLEIIRSDRGNGWRVWEMNSVRCIGWPTGPIYPSKTAAADAGCELAIFCGVPLFT